MNRFAIISVFSAISLVGCTAQQIEQLNTDEQAAEKIYSATTQATAAVKMSLTTQPANPEAARVIASAEKGEQTARLALDVARAALVAAQNHDAADPALRNSLAVAIGAIPSPWTPMLASLIPAAIPLLFSVIQSVKLGRAHQTVVTVTRELEEHRAALLEIRAKPQAAV